jgi:hypothetical protein
MVKMTPAQNSSNSQAGIGAVFTIDDGNKIVYCASAEGYFDYF